jgi:hypothetical protein
MGFAERTVPARATSVHVSLVNAESSAIGIKGLE